MAYLLDANVFIHAHAHYGFDFCPAFWEWLIKENEASVQHRESKKGTTE